MYVGFCSRLLQQLGQITFTTHQNGNQRRCVSVLMYCYSYVFIYAKGFLCCNCLQGGLNKFNGQHALRERARKIDQGILIIRYYQASLNVSFPLLVFP